MAAAAGTRRTTPRKVTSISDFEAERKKIVKARKGTKTFEWDVYDRTWHLKRPNIAFIAEQEESETIGSLVNTIVSHIVKEEREDFLKALADDEDLDFDVLGAMIGSMQKIVYAEIPG